MKIEQIRIRALREDGDLSQRDIARILNKSQQGYAHIENGRAELSVCDLKLLANFYQTSADFILGMTDETKPYPKTKLYLTAARSKDNKPKEMREIDVAKIKEAPETDEDI